MTQMVELSHSEIQEKAAPALDAGAAPRFN